MLFNSWVIKKGRPVLLDLNWEKTLSKSKWTSIGRTRGRSLRLMSPRFRTISSNLLGTRSPRSPMNLKKLCRKFPLSILATFPCSLAPALKETKMSFPLSQTKKFGVRWQVQWPPSLPNRHRRLQT